MATLNIDSLPTLDTTDLQSLSTPQPGAPSATAYAPIGLGKPLSVEILTIYTGSFKSKGLFAGNKRDILCVSGVKAAETFNAAPRAINLLEQKIPDNTYLEFSAFDAATPYVYYKKSVDTDTIDITIELAASSFDESLVDTITGLLKNAADLPIFMPAAGKLMAGSQFVNLVANGANDLFAPAPFLSETITLRFDTAGMPINIAQCMLLCRDQDENELNAYQVGVINQAGNAQMRLIKDGNVYMGDAPYVLVNIDGTEKDSLETWTATLASSSVLSQFYGSDDKVAGAGAIVQQAMSLYNDYTYRTKADALKPQIANATPGSDQYKALQNQYNAYVKNIVSDYFTNS